MAEKIALAIERMMLLSQNDISSAFTAAFNSPISAADITSITAAWKSTQHQIWLEGLLSQSHSELFDFPGIKYRQTLYSYPDGKMASVDVFQPFPKALPPSKALERAISQAYLEKIMPKEQVDKIMAQVNMEKFVRDQEKLMGAVKKIGRPVTNADLLAGKAEDVLKAALTRYAVKRAVVNGVWQGSLLTAVVNYRLLFDGNLKRYITRIGVSGLSSGTVQGLSMWLKHPFFSNATVLGVLVQSAVSTADLASTGDWVRFGKDLGINIVGSAGGFGGGMAGGALAGSMFGPVGAALGALAGGLGGAYVGHRIALKIPGIGGFSQQEISKMYATVKEDFARGSAELPSSVPEKEVVAAYFDSVNGPPLKMTNSHAASVEGLKDVLVALQSDSPESFDLFLDFLKDADKLSGV